MQHSLEEDILRKLLKKSPAKIAFACSGGADSTALFSLFCKLIHSIKNKPDLAICHINYNLRAEESSAEELFLKKLSLKHKVPFFVYSPKKTEKALNKIGVQDWARKERYQFFSKLAEQGWTIALAHTQDDLFENIFMRLARGTSPIAAKGMSENHGSYWRPFLETSKTQLLSWLKNEDIVWKEDSSNSSLDYTRNKFRHKIIPDLEKSYPSAKNHFIRFAEQSQELAKFAQRQLLDQLKTCQKENQGTRIIPLSFFKDLESALIHLILAHVIVEKTEGKFTPENKSLISIEKLIRKAPETSSKAQLTTNFFYKVVKGELFLGNFI